MSEEAIEKLAELFLKYQGEKYGLPRREAQ